MPSNPLFCRECGAVLDYTTQMEHWDWHRMMRSRLSELEGRVVELEAHIDALNRATGLDAVWRQRELEKRGSE